MLTILKKKQRKMEKSSPHDSAQLSAGILGGFQWGVLMIFCASGGLGFSHTILNNLIALDLIRENL